MKQGNFTHTDKERCIVGTWAVDEVRRAIEMGYGVLDVFEFWEYEETCFDKDTNPGVLFAEYGNMFLKLKYESSGYHPGFKVKTIRKDTLRTTGTQREFF